MADHIIDDAVLYRVSQEASLPTEPNRPQDITSFLQ